MQTPSLLITGHFTTLHDCTNPQSNYYRYVFFNSRDEFLHPHWCWMLNITYFKPPKSKGAVLPHLQKFFWAMQRLCTAAHSWEAWGGNDQQRTAWMVTCALGTLQSNVQLYLVFHPFILYCLERHRIHIYSHRKCIRTCRLKKWLQGSIHKHHLLRSVSSPKSNTFKKKD